jgi:sialate O-acetylesterase
MENHRMKTNSILSPVGSFLVLVTVGMPAAVSRADESLAVAPVYGDHMVLQREMKLPMWGIGKAGSEVTVTFAGQAKKTTVNSAGQWRVVLDAMEASSKPRRINVSDGRDDIVFEDVLVGEVWLCSGQSNMQFKLSNCENADAEIAASNHPELRLNGGQGWSVSSPESVPGFSGVAYFFGRKLNAETGVPVGLIARALGGTPVEWWTPANKLDRVDFAKATMANPSEEWMKYEKAVAEWKEKVKTQGRKVAGKKPAPAGSAEEGVLNGIYAPGKVGSLYARHLAPMAGFAIRGAIWYQGERNSKAGVEASKAYRPLLANMITSWREEWGQGDFAFLVVQLPTFAGGGEGWRIVQEAQAAAVGDVPNAGYIDIRDQPDGGLHPKNKKPVGERLAALAMEEFVK